MSTTTTTTTTTVTQIAPDGTTTVTTTTVTTTTTTFATGAGASGAAAAAAAAAPPPQLLAPTPVAVTDQSVQTQEADEAVNVPPADHPLNKPSNAARVLLFACRRPKDVFLLATVSHCWREFFVVHYFAGKPDPERWCQEFKSYFFYDRFFDANATGWQTLTDMKQIWLQAAAFRCADDSVRNKFDATLMSQLDNGIDYDGWAAQKECAHAADAKRDRDSWRHPEFKKVVVPHPRCRRIGGTLSSVTLTPRSAMWAE